MKVFILIHEYLSSEHDIVGVFSTVEKARDAFNFYIDELEKTQREQTPETVYDFNRFSEPNQDVILYANNRHPNQRNESVSVQVKNVE